MDEARSLAIAAARAGGAVIAAAVRQPGWGVRHKGAVDLVTEVDLASEAAVVRFLEQHCAGVPILAEEGSGASAASTRWIIDPLDGTTNFVHGYPHFAVSVALEEEGALRAGCIYDPLRDEVWSAAAGEGATCNGQRLQVSATETLNDALLVTGFPYDRRQRADFYLSFVDAMMRRCQGIRRSGAATLDFCSLAAGRVDGFWEFGLAPWDMAAGALLVREAGGRVTDLRGGTFHLGGREVLATNTRTHPEMTEVLVTLLSCRPS
jgi:myo-inositol-1(or 4)-monophosphatase